MAFKNDGILKKSFRTGTVVSEDRRQMWFGRVAAPDLRGSARIRHDTTRTTTLFLRHQTFDSINILVS